MHPHKDSYIDAPNFDQLCTRPRRGLVSYHKTFVGKCGILAVRRRPPDKIALREDIFFKSYMADTRLNRPLGAYAMKSEKLKVSKPPLSKYPEKCAQ